VWRSKVAATLPEYGSGAAGFVPNRQPQPFNSKDSHMLKRAVARPTLLIATMLLATACSAPSPDATAQAPAPASASSTAAAASSPADATPAAASAASDSTASTAAASTASTAAASPAADASPPKGAPAGAAPVEGTDYTTIDTPDQPTGDKVQVTEVFGFGCIHCSDLQPELATWKKTLPPDVQFNYLPAPFGGMPDQFMPAFYAAQAMGVEEKSHDAVFKAVFTDKTIAAPDDIPKFYAQFGVNPTVFASTMKSFAVKAKVAAATDQAMRWGITGTPSIVVDGKYRVPELTAGGAQGMFHTIEWLVAKQRPLHAKH
jgi:thiol:disulfide interchange protein DsbA